MINDENKRSVAVGLSLPKYVKDKIDRDRGDIPFSRYILRIIEKAYEHDQV